jgi:DNA-binding CsgD family transcriptional regulator
MDEIEQVSDLIGDIYDAALDPALWPVVLEKSCGFVRGACAALVSQNPVIGAGQFYFSWGLDPHYERLYLEKYIRLNTVTTITLTSVKAGEIVSTEMLMPYGEYLSSRFHVEWAKPQGYCDFVGAILEKTACSFANISVIRHERHGIVDDETRRRMGLLAPHFRRAVTIGNLIDLHKVEAGTLADMLDGLATATLLVDADGRIVQANLRGRVMLEERSILRSTARQLSVSDPKAEGMLRDMIAAASTGDTAVGAKGIAVPIAARDGERWVAHVLPLTSGARRQAGLNYAAVAAIFVRKAALELPHPLETIASAFDLTPAELRVMMAVVEVGGVPEIAPVLGISETTVKTHLQHVFEKTGSQRQADLVKLVAGYMSPLGG